MFGPSIPLYQIQRFRNLWLKYGQNYIENQKLIKTTGKMEFLQVFNNKINHEYSTTK